MKALLTRLTQSLAARPMTWLLLVLLLWVQAQLWLGKGGLIRGWQLNQELKQVQTQNRASSERNQILSAEVADLKEGLEMVEEKARSELGMLRPNEIYVKYDPHRSR